MFPSTPIEPSHPQGGDGPAWFDLAFGASPEGVMLSDPGGRVIRANLAFQQMLGLCEGDIAGRPVEGLVPPEDHALESLVRERLLSGERSAEEYDKAYLAAGGGLRRARVKAWIPRDAEGRPLGLIEMACVRGLLEGSDALFLRTLLDTIPCPLFFKDAEGRYLGCNAAFEEVLGKPREQIIGRTVHELSPQDLADVYQERDLALLRTKGTQAYEGQVSFADGRRHDMVISKAVFRDARGEVAGLVGVLLDITQRKLAEQGLRDTLELNQKLLRAAPIGVGVFHATTGRCVTANESLARITGGTVEQLLCHNFRELESWKRGGLLSAAERAIATGEEQHFETEMTSSFGRHYWVSVVFTPFISGGEPHLLMLHEDISERRAAQEALQQSEARYRTLADQLSEGLAMTDTAYRYTYCNPRLLQILGREDWEVLGNTLMDFIPERERPALLEKQEEHRQGPIHLFETHLQRKDGTEVAVLLSVSHLKGRDGEFQGSLELITDISQMRMYEQALQQAQLQVIQHEKMAALGTMVTGVAHEINNPTHFMHLGAKSLESGLASFKGELQDMITGEDPEAWDYLERRFASFDASLRHILEAFRRIRAIVQDLRLFARVGERGRQEVDLAEGLRLALRLVQAKHPGIEVLTDFPGPVRLSCFPAELNQTFLNILDNACRAIEDRPRLEGDGFRGRLEVTLREEGAGVHLAIADNGCGMTEPVKVKVFEPFFTTRPVGQGAGLGLAVAFQVIEDHGGTIRVDSEPGIGTTVRIFLPFPT